MKAKFVGGICLSICLFVARPSAAGSDAVLRWNENAGRAAMAACLTPAGNPLPESRMYAMVHLAMHDALNAIDRQSRPYAFDVRVTGPVSPAAALAAAARDVLVSAIGQLRKRGMHSKRPCDGRGRLRGSARGHSNRCGKDRGVKLGQAAAAAIIDLRSTDGSDTPLVDPAYPQGTQPGEYRFTPGVPFAFAPGGAT